MAIKKENIDPDEYKTKLLIGEKFAITLDETLCVEIIKDEKGYRINSWRCPSVDENDLLYSNEVWNTQLHKFEILDYDCEENDDNREN